MAINIQTNDGLVIIKKDVIAKLAGSAALDCYGIVGMSAKSVKDGIAYVLKKESLTKGVKVETLEDNTISITLHIIVEYSTNIPAIGDSIINTVKYEVEEYSGLTVSDVHICVEGIRNDN